MFKDDKVILKMMAVDASTLHPNNFYCLDVVQSKRQDLISKARDKRSSAEDFYKLALTFRDEYRHLVRMESNKSLPQVKEKYGNSRRNTEIYRHLLG